MTEAAKARRRRGIPYTLSEARLVLKTQGHQMDAYHRSLFEWLIQASDSRTRLTVRQRGVHPAPK